MRQRKKVLPHLPAAPVLPAFSTPQTVQEASGSSQQQEWELIIPTGEIKKSSVDLAPRISALDGKTVVLRWNGKNNGDVALNRLAELFLEKYSTVKIVKSYEMDKSINIISASAQNSQRITDYLKTLRPDLVIAATAD